MHAKRGNSANKYISHTDIYKKLHQFPFIFLTSKGIILLYFYNKSELFIYYWQVLKENYFSYIYVLV